MTLRALRMGKINKTSVSLHRKESQELVPGYFNMKVQKYFEKSVKKKKKKKKKRKRKEKKKKTKT